MIRNILTATVATAAILVAAPALAHPGGGGAGGPGGGAAAGAIGGTHGGAGGLGSGAMTNIERGGFGSGSMTNVTRGGTGIGASSFNSPSTRTNNSNRDFGADDSGRAANSSSQIGRTTNLERAESSQGFLHASPTAIAHASPNSVLARSAVPSALLPGLATGMTVESSNGTTLGTVTNVLTTRNGSIAGVIVTESNGQTVRIPASSLSISGNTLTANASAFGNVGVPSALLPGLATGLTVTSSTGMNLGTISQVITGPNGTITGVIVTNANGQSVQLPASSLAISGSGVTANSAEAFEFQGVPSSLLPGLSSGLTVDTSAGTAFGTISQVNVGANGNISSVVITASNGQTFTVPASSLSISGNTVTVASANEAFEGSGVPTAFLPGLTTGLTVDTSSGTSLGTVSQVITGANGTISGVVITSSTGQTVTLPASDLSISGSTVTVTSTGI